MAELLLGDALVVVFVHRAKPVDDAHRMRLEELLELRVQRHVRCEVDLRTMEGVVVRLTTLAYRELHVVSLGLRSRWCHVPASPV